MVVFYLRRPRPKASAVRRCRAQHRRRALLPPADARHLRRRLGDCWQRAAATTTSNVALPRRCDTIPTGRRQAARPSPRPRTMTTGTASRCAASAFRPARHQRIIAGGRQFARAHRRGARVLAATSSPTSCPSRLVLAGAGGWFLARRSLVTRSPRWPNRARHIERSRP